MSKCDCIEKAKKSVKKSTDDPEATIETELCIDNQTSQMSIRLKGAAVKFRKKKKDGSFTKAQTTGFINYSYCGLCGIKL